MYKWRAAVVVGCERVTSSLRVRSEGGLPPIAALQKVCKKKEREKEMSILENIFNLKLIYLREQESRAQVNTG